MPNLFDRQSETTRRRSAVRRSSVVLLRLSLVVVLLLTGACGNRNRTAEKLAQDTQQVEDFDNSLTFNAVTLEEFDSKGRLWWKVKAKQASYSKDKKIARIQEPTGEFFQDGKSILQVKAQSGEVRQNGQTIFLRGKIVATDTRDGLVMQGDELEWQPRNDLLIVRNHVTGTHKQAKVTANEGTFYSRKRQMDLKGQVNAQSTNPDLHFVSDHIIWQLEPQTLTSDRPLELERLENKVVSDRATANQGVANLKTKLVTLTQSAQLTLADPPVQLSSNSLVWNLTDKTIVSDQALSILNRQQQVTLTGNQGRMDLKTKMLYLNGDVQGIAARNQSQINSDRLSWNVSTQQFDAEGNVRYQQGQPPMNLAGPKATGTLKDQNVLVSGGRVVTQVVP